LAYAGWVLDARHGPKPSGLRPPRRVRTQHAAGMDWASDMNDDRNRRQYDRHNVEANIEIFHKGYAIEFPTKDISLTGMGVEALGVDHLKVGDKVIVVLAQETEVVAEVVGMRRETLHLRFSPESMDEVKYYLEVKVGGDSVKKL
jgi:PilZ domain